MRHITNTILVPLVSLLIYPQLTIDILSIWRFWIQVNRVKSCQNNLDPSPPDVDLQHCWKQLGPVLDLILVDLSDVVLLPGVWPSCSICSCSTVCILKDLNGDSAEHLNPQNIVDPESASNSVDPADAIGRVILHGACLKTSSRPGQSVSPTETAAARLYQNVLSWFVW